MARTKPAPPVFAHHLTIGDLLGRIMGSASNLGWQTHIVAYYRQGRKKGGRGPRTLAGRDYWLKRKGLDVMVAEVRDILWSLDGIAGHLGVKGTAHRIAGQSRTNAKESRRLALAWARTREGRAYMRPARRVLQRTPRKYRSAYRAALADRGWRESGDKAAKKGSAR